MNVVNALCKLILYGGICIVIVVPSALTENPKFLLEPCFSSSVNLTLKSTLLQGKWSKITQINTNKCSADQRRDERSCTTKAKAQFAIPKYYEPSSCQLPDFDARIFSNVLRTRSLYFVGDSVMMQQKTRIQCELEDFQKNIRIHNIRISEEKNLKTGIKRLGRISEDSIVLINIGLHYNNEIAYSKFLNEFESNCLKRSCTKGKLVWQETSAQHFPNSENGYFRSRGNCKKGCETIKRERMISGDFRNRMANQLMWKYGVLVLPTFEITQAAEDMHTQFNSKTGMCDCTHYCNSPYGVFRVYNRVLQAVLLAKMV